MLSDRDTILRFLDYSASKGFDLRNPIVLGQAYESFMRQANPFGPRTSFGKIYDDGPWTWYANDIISDVARGGSPLLRWLPTRAVVYRNETVAHLSWVAPDGWDGEDYDSYLEEQGAELGECDYGFQAKFDTCQYNIQFGRMTTKSDPLKLVPDLIGQKDYENSPIYFYRGDDKGLPIMDDAEFAAAKAALLMEQHVNYNIARGIYGHAFQSDGLSEVISVGYVDSHIVGEGACDFADPTVIDGSAFSSPDEILQLIRGLYRRIKDRAMQRNMEILPGDIAVVMPGAMWAVLADRIPLGGMYPAPTSQLTGGNTIVLVEGERNRVRTGGLGYGFMPIDGDEVPIIPCNELGQNASGNTEIVSDIFILVRRAAGITLLEQQWLDYTALPSTVPNATYQLAQGGIMRMGWLEYNQMCYQAYIEAYNRLVSRFQPLQGRITSVTVKALGPHIIESTSYVDAFYANEGVPGSLGAGV